MKKIEIKVMTPLGVHKEGSVVRLLADDNGTPLSVYWRARLNDAKKDRCCRILGREPKNPRPTAKKSGKASGTKTTGEKTSVALKSDAKKPKPKSKRKPRK